MNMALDITQSITDCVMSKSMFTETGYILCEETGRHLRIHTGEKPYALARKNSLKGHYAVHNKELFQ